MDFKLVQHASDNTSLVIPDGTKREHFVRWVEELPSIESPVWLGLPGSAEVLLLTKQGQDMLRKVLKLQTLVEEDSKDKDSDQTKDKRPAWTISLKASIQNWLKILPQVICIVYFPV